MTDLQVLQADITTLAVDAIVNAANGTLLGGGGVDGAIHRAAGPELLAECRGLGGCATGDAKTTRGYRLPARWVIHTVGPVWHGGDSGEAQLLASCYRRCIEEAVRVGAQSLAFPAISTGVYGYSKPEAAAVAIATITETLAVAPSIREIVLCAFSAGDFEILQRAVERGRGSSNAGGHLLC